MASKSLMLLLGLLFAIILVISSDVVSARNDPVVAETKGVQVDGHHHHCHHHHCSEKENEGTDHQEEAKTETTGGVGDGHYKCKHWPHC